MKSHYPYLPIYLLLFLVGITTAGCIATLDDAQIEPTVEQSAPPTPIMTAPVEVGVSETTQPSLAGTSWVMSSVNGTAALEGTLVTANFTADGAVTGSGGCNNYTFSYQTNAPNYITVDRGATTTMACEVAVTEQETQYFRALDDAATYLVGGDTLTLTSADGSTTVVFAVPTLTDLTGAGTELGSVMWVVTGYNNGNEAVVGVLEGTTLTAVFGADGALTGSAGCNNYNASYTAEGDQISIGAVATTMMACEAPEGIMQQETAYLAAIELAMTYQISGNTLELRDANGALQASYVAGP
ncbi:MAG TPA: META domain-containing protein [Chloroflexota bacterium]|nr:META domain-containing protein [Chloroflexota bacterium]HUM70802.1 META domain-containing protein [Chloroflexota bacterium]